MFLIQHKQVGKRYHRLDLEELKQLRSDSFHEDKVPVYMIEFDEFKEPFYIINEVAFNYLKEQLQENDV